MPRLCTNTNRDFTRGTRAGGGGRRLVCSAGTERGYSVKVGDCMRGPGPDPYNANNNTQSSS